MKSKNSKRVKELFEAMANLPPEKKLQAIENAVKRLQKSLDKYRLVKESTNDNN